MKHYKFTLFRNFILTCWNMLSGIAVLAVATQPLAALPETFRATLAGNPLLSLALGGLIVATGFLGSSRLYADYIESLTYRAVVAGCCRKASRMYLLRIASAVGKIAAASLAALLVTVLWPYGSVQASAASLAGHVNAVITLGATVGAGTLLTCCIALLFESPPPRKSNFTI